MHFSDNFADEKGLESTKILKMVVAWVNETRKFHEKIGYRATSQKKLFSSLEKTRIWKGPFFFSNRI